MDLSYEALEAKKPADMDRTEIIYALRYHMHPIVYHEWVLRQDTELLRLVLSQYRNRKIFLKRIGDEISAARRDRVLGFPIIGMDFGQGPDAWAMVIGHKHASGKICIERVLRSDPSKR